MNTNFYEAFSKYINNPSLPVINAGAGLGVFSIPESTLWLAWVILP